MPPPFQFGFQEDTRFAPERSCRNGMTEVEAERAWVVRMLWKAFPNATSENDLADQVAEHLTTEKRPINARTVRFWLRQDTTPHFRYILPILALAGAEAAMDAIFGLESRT